MKLSLLLTVLVMSTVLYEAQGIRPGKVNLSASSHQGIIKSSLVTGSNQDGGLPVKTAEVSSGMNRKLMTKTSSSSPPSITTSKNHKIDGNKHDPKPEIKSSQGPVEKAKLSVSPSPKWSGHMKQEVTPERYPDVIDITGMDYSPARRKPPIHN